MALLCSFTILRKNSMCQIKIYKPDKLRIAIYIQTKLSFIKLLVSSRSAVVFDFFFCLHNYIPHSPLTPSLVLLDFLVIVYGVQYHVQLSQESALSETLGPSGLWLFSWNEGGMLRAVDGTLCWSLTCLPVYTPCWMLPLSEGGTYEYDGLWVWWVGDGICKSEGIL